MIPQNRIATHPGVILLKEYLEPLGLTQKALATHISVPIQRINKIVRGKRGVTPQTAWLLAKAFSTTPECWLNLQATHDLSISRLMATAFKGQLPDKVRHFYDITIGGLVGQSTFNYAVLLN